VGDTTIEDESLQFTDVAPVAVATTTTTTTNGTTTDAVINGGADADKKPPKKRKVSGEDSPSKKSKKIPSSSSSVGTENSNSDSINNCKKTQIRYDPEVPMNKEQLAAWRREARRVRNRESAAASRQRIRGRIQELEEEVGEWKSKYAHAVQRLEALEAAIGNKEPEAVAAAAAAAGAAAAAAAEEEEETERGTTNKADIKSSAEV
jgi:hypothetical protein